MTSPPHLPHPPLTPPGQVRAEYRQIFLEMGFTEMPTNNYVESRCLTHLIHLTHYTCFTWYTWELSPRHLPPLTFPPSFWNFDALFQPQQHPARSMPGLSIFFNF